MLSLIIVGAGGLGRVTQQLALKDPDFNRIWNVGGFLDTRPHALDGYDVGVPMVGDPRTQDPREGLIYVAAIGDPKLKKELLAPLLAKNACFIALRGSARMGLRCKWGRSVFGEDTKLSVDVTVGDYCYIDGDAIVGHDVTIGDYAHIGPRAFIGGRAKIGALATIHSMATVMMDAQIGEGAVIGAGAVVSGKIPPYTTMLGNPARKFEFKRG